MPYIAIIPNYWARHDSPEIALANAKKTAGKSKDKKVPYHIYKVEDPEAYCSEIDGTIYHRKGTKVELYEKFEPPIKRRT